MSRLIFVLAAVCLAGCVDRGVPLDPPLAPDLPASEARALHAAWPAVLDACPGLRRHGDWYAVEQVVATDFAVGRLIRVSMVPRGDGAAYYGIVPGQQCHYLFDARIATLKIADARCIRACLDESAHAEHMGAFEVDL